MCFLGFEKLSKFNTGTSKGSLGQPDSVAGFLLCRAARSHAWGSELPLAPGSCSCTCPPYCTCARLMHSHFASLHLGHFLLTSEVQPAGERLRCCGWGGVHLLGPGARSTLCLERAAGWFLSGGWTCCMSRRADCREIWRARTSFPRCRVRSQGEVWRAQSSSLFSSLLWDLKPFGSSSVV